MANLNTVPTGATTVQLPNFYNGQAEEIKLKAELSPQKNAALFYKKAKNQAIEIEFLTQSLKSKENELQSLSDLINSIEQARDLKSLRSIVKDLNVDKTQGKETSVTPFHKFEHKGFRILVGKNALNNDLLTLKHATKDDLWLHAKDVAGSHVVIKHQPGKKFPKDVIERAAQLAAYNSKRKTESLCPVIFTPKKFVRKRKGDPAGAMVVEKEEVIMVVPKLD
jgi:predicted ribosome quality control (RQC) complex YloA/Tae2 family protein